MMKAIILLGLVLSGACVHNEKAKIFSAFPTRFVADQSLRVTAPDGEKSLSAQLDRYPDHLELLLLEAIWGVPILRASITPGSPPLIRFQAKETLGLSLPLEEIAQSIEALYWAREFEVLSSGPTLEDKAHHVHYALEQIDGQDDCLFPKLIILRFADTRYQITIETKSWSCSESTPEVPL